MRLSSNFAAAIALAVCGCTSPHYTVLYIGVDGPRTSEAYEFDSAADVRASWIAAALPNELEKVLAHIDFNQEVLIANAVGERVNVNTPVRVARVDGLIAYIEIGVNIESCSHAHARSYPFVLIAVPKPTSQFPSRGYDHQNYPNGCMPALNGVPHDSGS